METLRVRCRSCGKELQGHSSRTYSCGCPNMTTIRGDSITAVDLSHVVMLNSSIHNKDKDRKFIRPKGEDEYRLLVWYCVTNTVKNFMDE